MIPEDGRRPVHFAVRNAPPIRAFDAIFSSVEGWVDRRFINLARRCDRWAQDGPRETYPHRRQLAFAIRKTIREDR